MAEKQELKINSIRPTEFFAKLFEARDTIHLCHLAAKAFAEHLILDDFYKDILKDTDKLVEAYQGKYGIQDITIPSSKKTDSLSYLNSLAKFIDTNRDCINGKGFQAIIDDIAADLYQTIYKLTNLK